MKQRKRKLTDIRFLSALTALMCVFGGPCAAEVKVIVNPSIRAVEISADDLKSVFLGIKTSLNGGIRLKPVLGKSGASHEEFLRAYLGKTDGGLQTYYRSLVFTGKSSMPITFSSDAEVLLFVANTPGAIGYVDVDTPVVGVNILRVK